MIPAGRILGRELGLTVRRPGTWLLTAGYLLAGGLFYLLRLDAGQGGDHGGLLRELGAVLLPVSCLLGAGALAAPERLRHYLRGPFTPGEVCLGMSLPAVLWAAGLGLVGGFLPLVTWADAPVDLGVLLAGGLTLACIGAALAGLGAAFAAGLRSMGAGALAAFLLGLAMWGAPGLAAATGLVLLTRFDLTAGLLAGGAGWVSLGASSPCLVVLLVSLALTREAIVGRRF